MSREKQTRWWRRLHALAELAGDAQQKDIAETLGVSPAAVSPRSRVRVRRRPSGQRAVVEPDEKRRVGVSATA